MCEHRLTFCHYLSSHFLCSLSKQFNSTSEACVISSLITTERTPLILTSPSLPRSGSVFPPLRCAFFLGRDQQSTTYGSAYKEGA